MLEQAVPIAPGRLKLQGRGSRYRRRLYRLTVDHLGLVASRAAVKAILNGRDVCLDLLCRQVLVSVCVFDLMLLRHEQNSQLAISCGLRATDLLQRLVTVLAPVAQKTEIISSLSLLREPGFLPAGLPLADF